MRRDLVAVVLVAVVVAVAGAAATGGAARAQQARQGQAQTIGIRLLDAPTNRSDDPRAREYIVDHLAPGATISRRVEVTNGTDKPQSIQMYAAAATVQDGAFQFGDDRAANELTDWTRVDPATLALQSGAKGIATVRIAVPANASAGERYGVVWAAVGAPAPAGGGIAAVNRVGVRIYLSVGPGGEPPTDFAITTLQAQRAGDGSPQVAATVRNTGGRAADLAGELRLANGPGGLSAGPFPAKLGTTLGVGQTEPVLVTLDRAVPPGPWDAHIVLRSGRTEREATATITFPKSPSAKGRSVRAHGIAGRGRWAAVAGAVLVLAAVLAVILAVRRRRSPPAREGSP